ncbi:YfiR family protein [Nitrospira sp. M1]
MCVEFPRNAFADSPREYQVKAAFLYHFVQFTEWPEHAFSNPDMDIRICVYGDDPFTEYLARAFMGKALHARQFIIHPRVSAFEGEQCHVLFMNRQIDVAQPDVRKVLQRSQALTVGEADNFLEEGGMIQFYRVENHIRFAVNPDALERKHIHLSSKLLRLARIAESK